MGRTERLSESKMMKTVTKRRREKGKNDIRTKLKKTDVVEEFLKGEENEDELEYECPIQKEKQKRKDEIQKEIKALAKELKPKKQKEKKPEEEEPEKISEEEKNNGMLHS